MNISEKKSKGLYIVEQILQKLKISYRYSVDILDSRSDNNPIFVVAFSKPTNIKPIPEIVVYSEFEVFMENYHPFYQFLQCVKLTFEGQKSYRIIKVLIEEQNEIPKLISSDEDVNKQFKEDWIDIIYKHKECARNRFPSMVRENDV